MKTSNQNARTNSTSVEQAEETLRLLARLPSPQGLEERLQARLQATAGAAQPRVLRWPVALRLESAWLRMAVAAVIVAVVVGGAWVVSSRLQPAQPAQAISIPPHEGAQSGFSSAGAMRTPQTLDRPIVKEPGTTPAPTHPHAARKPVRRGKPAMAGKASAQPAVPVQPVQ
jgi:hypothetical protein